MPPTIYCVNILSYIVILTRGLWHVHVIAFRYIPDCTFCWVAVIVAFVTGQKVLFCVTLSALTPSRHAGANEHVVKGFPISLALCSVQILLLLFLPNLDFFLHIQFCAEFYFIHFGQKTKLPETPIIALTFSPDFHYSPFLLTSMSQIASGVHNLVRHLFPWQ